MLMTWCISAEEDDVPQKKFKYVVEVSLTLEEKHLKKAIKEWVKEMLAGECCKVCVRSVDFE